MLESDNNVSSWYQKKTPDLKMEFNGGFYNMYDNATEYKSIPTPDGKMIKTVVPSKQQTSIYRNGRISQFFFIEGIEDPLDFRNNRISSNPQMRKQLLSVDLTKLWTMGNSLKQWLLYAIVGLLAGLIIGNIIGGYGKIPAPKPVEQAIFLLWMVRNARKP